MKQTEGHIRRSELSAIILAGGKSSRMGTDKGMIHLNGRPFIEHILEAVRPLAEESIIISDHQHYDQFHTRRIEDEIKNHGPLAGLFTGLKASKNRWNLVLSCDVPLVTSNLLKLLLDRKYDPYNIVQLQARDRDMPLIARYNKNCLQSCEQLIRRGEKRLMALQDVHSHFSIPVPLQLEKQAVNVNRISDLKITHDEN